MQTMKKAFAVILVLALVLSLNVTAFAAVGKGTITISNSVTGITYSAYRIFDLDSYAGTNYNYKVNPAFDAFANKICFKDAAHKAGEVTEINDALIKISADGFVTPWWNGSAVTTTENADWAKAVGEKFKEYVRTNKVASSSTVVGNGSAATIADLDAGYYFVNTAMGSLVTLDTLTDKGVTIEEKNTAPTVTKKIIEGDTKVAANSAAVGTNVKFEVVVNVESGAENYVVSDNLHANLTLASDTVHVFYAADDAAFSEVPATVTSSTTVTNWKLSGTSTGFDVAFDNAYLATLNGVGQLKVQYEATVAASGLDGSKDANVFANDVVLKYGHNPAADTDPSVDPDTPFHETPDTPDTKTRTLNYNIDILKYTGEGSEITRLDGAKFQLYADQDGTKGYAATGTDGAYTIGAASLAAGQTLVTDTKGNLAINGLKEGTYYLKEIEAPKGYNKLTEMIKIEITDADKSDAAVDTNNETDIQVNGESGTVNAIGVQNNAGNKLPSTGGVGTTIFYVVGAAIMVTAMVLLITKKKMSV